jgi:hypothetical protein
MWLSINALLYSQATVAAEPIAMTIFTEDSVGELVPVAGGADPFTALGTILNLDTKHLAALGVGIVFGATTIAYQLEVGEITGILVGVIAGDLFYRTFLAKHSNKHSWLPEDLF